MERSMMSLAATGRYIGFDHHHHGQIVAATVGASRIWARGGVSRPRGGRKQIRISVVGGDLRTGPTNVRSGGPLGGLTC